MAERPALGWLREAWHTLRSAWWPGAHPREAVAQGALFFLLEENTRPRGTGALSIFCCGSLVAHAAEVPLQGATADPVLTLLRTHSAALRLCRHQRLAFENVSPWLQGQIRAELVALQVAVGGKDLAPRQLCGLARCGSLG